MRANSFAAGGGLRLQSALLCCGVGLWLSPAHAQTTPDAPPPPATGPVPIPLTVPAPAKGQWSGGWFNPDTAPFLPVPLIAVDPDSGTTLGLIPVWIKTDDHHDISQIIAPDILHNPYFGWGLHGRLYSYSSSDEQWNVVAGIKERVERNVDAEYQVGRLRDQHWSYNYSLIYDRSGTPRFYGFGNESLAIDVTNYTNNQELAQAQIGYNLSHQWQIQYTARMRVVQVLPGTLADVASLQTRFGRILGVGVNKELLNRMALVYDTRDDVTVPGRGTYWTVFGGFASRRGLLNNSLYVEEGVDGRNYLPLAPGTVLATHVALNYQVGTHNVPFWALNSLGGGQSVIGGEQPLRGYGQGRYYDHDSFSASVELRHKATSFHGPPPRWSWKSRPSWMSAACSPTRAPAHHPAAPGLRRGFPGCGPALRGGLCRHRPRHRWRRGVHRSELSLLAGQPFRTGCRRRSPLCRRPAPATGRNPRAAVRPRRPSPPPRSAARAAAAPPRPPSICMLSAMISVV